jgi:hypothetical protein
MRYKRLRFSAEGMKFSAKENQKEWFDDLILKIESLSSLFIFAHVQFKRSIAKHSTEIREKMDNIFYKRQRTSNHF